MLRRSDKNRVGFTLIELLVVIAIIAILVALLVSAVMGVLINREHVRTRNDISGLSHALTLFKKNHNAYPPSRLWLSPNEADYTSGVGIESAKYLRRIWPQIRFRQFCQSVANLTPAGVWLEGDQCLVFFLQGPTGTGFSMNAQNPLAAGGTRDGPYFEFPVARLKQYHLARNNPFPSFEDGYAVTKPIVPGGPMGRPYLYFSSNTRPNGYHFKQGAPPASAGDPGDCPSGGGTRQGQTGAVGGVLPYMKTMAPPPGTPPPPPPAVAQATTFYNPDSFQIISAGRDGIFNPGGLWQAGQFSAGGADDVTNFTEGFLAQR